MNREESCAWCYVIYGGWPDSKKPIMSWFIQYMISGGQADRDREKPSWRYHSFSCWDCIRQLLLFLADGIEYMYSFAEYAIVKEK